MLVAALTFCSIVLFSRTVTILNPAPSQPPPPSVVIFAASGLSIAIFFGLFAAVMFFDGLMQMHDSQWRRVFRVVALSTAAIILAPCWAGPFGHIAALILVATVPFVMLAAALHAVIVDVRERGYRDPWHWLGVVTLFGASAHIALLIFVVPRFGVIP